MQLVIWFVGYVVVILALASWRSHHDAATRGRKSRPRGADPVDTTSASGHDAARGWRHT